MPTPHRRQAIALHPPERAVAVGKHDARAVGRDGQEFGAGSADAVFEGRGRTDIVVVVVVGEGGGGGRVQAVEFQRALPVVFARGDEGGAGAGFGGADGGHGEPVGSHEVVLERGERDREGGQGAEAGARVDGAVQAREGAARVVEDAGEAAGDEDGAVRVLVVVVVAGGGGWAEGVEVQDRERARLEERGGRRGVAGQAPLQPALLGARGGGEGGDMVEEVGGVVRRSCVLAVAGVVQVEAEGRADGQGEGMVCFGEGRDGEGIAFVRDDL